MRVFVFTKYSKKGASSRLRTFQYLRGLSELGVEFTVNSLFDDDYLRELYFNGSVRKLHVVRLYLNRLVSFFRCLSYEIIWIEKELLPYFPPIFELFLRLINKPYVVDYDDAIFHNYDRSPSLLVRTILGRKIDAVMGGASCVVVGNLYLADRAHRAGANFIEVIPTVVDIERYTVGIKPKSSPLTIGWIGTPSTQKYLLAIRDVLRKVCRDEGARLLVVGSDNNIKDQLPGVPVDVVQWSEDSEAGQIRHMDVGIMPLRNGPWESGKCGYKIIQYMASGVPVVASPVGVNVEIINDSGCGRLAATEQEWISALTELLGDRGLRESLGLSGRVAVEQRFSLQVTVPRWHHILQSLVLKSD